MSKKLYVGNLPWSVLSRELEEVLSGLGLVFKTVEVVFDRETDRSRGFAFVHFDLDESAEMARSVLDGYLLGGRPLVASFATSERREKPSGRRDFSRPRVDHDRGQRRERGRGGRRGDDWGGR
jgi:RNA recognition motif-containing protein